MPKVSATACFARNIAEFLLSVAGAGCVSGGAVRGFGGPDHVTVAPDGEEPLADDEAGLPDDAANSEYLSIAGQLSGDLQDVAVDLFDTTNRARVAAGLQPLYFSFCAEHFAYQRAVNLVGAPDLVHAPLTDLNDACALAGQVSGENLLRGSGTADQMVTAWLASPTHRANLLNPNYTDAAIACVPDPQTLPPAPSGTAEPEPAAKPEATEPIICSHLFLG